MGISKNDRIRDVWFTSDLHLNHRGVITRQGRPFDSVEDMNEAIIAKWNGILTKRDNIYVLGDFAYDTDYGTPLPKLFKALKGRKHLIVGNHDEAHRRVLDLGWESVNFFGSVRLTEGKHPIWATMCHYAMETWRGMSGGSYMLHGHSHGTMKRTLARRFDVGTDVWEYTPIDASSLLHIGNDEEFEPTDMHGDYAYDGSTYEF